MPEHPCAEGLSAACFKAYPEYARKALAYKILHQILPHQLTRILPRMPIPPDFAWQDRWNAWLDFVFTGDDFPWNLFPEGWKPGDPLPFGVEIPPNVVIPQDFNPQDHPPEFYIPGYSPIPTPPDTGAEAPLFVEPFEPGPIRGQGFQTPYVFDIGSLLVEQGSNLRALNVGDSMTFYDLGMAIETWMDARVHAIDIKIGRYNIPLDSVGLEIWTADASYKPVLIVGSGSSNTKKGSTLSEYSTGMDYTRFLFLGTPELSVTNKYAIVIGRTGDVWTDRYYQVGEYQYGSRNYHYQLESGTWYIRGTSRLNCRIWGIAL